VTAETKPSVDLHRVVVLGANGAMGAGSAALFAAGGCDVMLVARDLGKCEGALAAIQGIAKSEQIADRVRAMTYADGLEIALADADLIFECLAEDLELKREMLAAVDRAVEFLALGAVLEQPAHQVAEQRLVRSHRRIDPAPPAEPRRTDDLVDLNDAFHNAIYAGSQNGYIAEITLATRVRVQPFRRAQFRNLGRLAKSHAEHDRVVVAIMRGDRVGAAAAMRAHIELVRGEYEIYAVSW